MIKYIFLALLFFNSNALAHDCISKRLAMDVGSGSLKSALYEFDNCNNEIHHKIASHTVHLKYEKCLLADSSKKVFISNDCINNTKRTLRRLQMKYGVRCGDDVQCFGVATAWARKASNSDQVLKLYSEAGINVKPLTQNEEGALGFYTLAEHIKYDPQSYEDIIVFDLGGGSFQISIKVGDEIKVLKGPNGVESFYKYMRSKYPLEDESKPYFTKLQINESVKELAQNIKNVLSKNPDLLERLKNPKTSVYAIGRPMQLGMRYQMNLGNKITTQDLYKTSLMFEGKSTEEIQSMFPELPDHYLVAAQSSLVIVQGIMEGSGMKYMNIEGAHPTDFIVSNKDYWQ